MHGADIRQEKQAFQGRLTCIINFNITLIVIYLQKVIFCHAIQENSSLIHFLSFFFINIKEREEQTYKDRLTCEFKHTF